MFANTSLDVTKDTKYAFKSIKDSVLWYLLFVYLLLLNILDFAYTFNTLSLNKILHLTTCATSSVKLHYS